VLNDARVAPQQSPILRSGGTIIAHLCVSSGLTFLGFDGRESFEFAISIGEDSLFSA
jgi:hypothetical protein